MLPDVPNEKQLRDYQAWWQQTGLPISEAVDRAGTPWLRMFDRQGTPIDEICFAPEYWSMLYAGYEAGVVWRAFAEDSLIPALLFDYIAAFYDIGVVCPYTVSLATALPLAKYGDAALKENFLPHLLCEDESVWQGATWMTEIKGGSDLGANVETVARRDGDRWLLTGDKYFASNAGAELAVVAARLDGAPDGVRGLGLFLLPRLREDGTLNYHIRRLKDKIATRSVPTGEVELRNSEAYLLGEGQGGIYLIMEVLNISRVANSIGAVALAQRAISEAYTFAHERVAFGKPIIEHPLMRQQFAQRAGDLQRAFALAWEALLLLDEVRHETAPYSDRFHLCRLMIHLAKYWTAEVAVQTAKWAMEVNGGMGVLAEYHVERLLREAMIIDIWEGPPHRQILDALEVIERKQAHKLLLDHLAPHVDESDTLAMTARIETHLKLDSDDKEAQAQGLIDTIAEFTARILLRRATPQVKHSIR
ncbi:MAG: acyl-CoA dehydrogenase [Chloroflexi bacterium]|nr:MAG: acyl-CoA dehydrogenase [Chloroflexota bacterium]